MTCNSRSRRILSVIAMEGAYIGTPILADVVNNACERPVERQTWRMQIMLAALLDCSEVWPIEVEERREMEEAVVRQNGKAATRRVRTRPRGDVRGKRFGFTFGRGDASSCVAEFGALSSFLSVFLSSIVSSGECTGERQHTKGHHLWPFNIVEITITTTKV
jgi:hypothetical protein